MRRRAVSPAILVARQARDLTLPFVGEMPRWQRRVAYIDAALTTRTADPSEHRMLARECDALMAEVRVALAGLDKAARRAPPHVAAHGRVDDVRRALVAMLARLQRLVPASDMPPAVRKWPTLAQPASRV